MEEEIIMREWILKVDALSEEIVGDNKKLKWSHKTHALCLKRKLNKKWKPKMKLTLKNKNKKKELQKSMKMSP